jgi:hypothetical protein
MLRSLIEMLLAALVAVARGLVRALALLTRAVAQRMPGPPSTEPPAPDIDGRRPETADTTALEMEMLRKNGHGGVR